MDEPVLPEKQSTTEAPRAQGTPGGRVITCSIGAAAKRLFQIITLSHRPVARIKTHQNLNSVTWDLSSWETPPFDVRAGLQQAEESWRSQSFNYCEAAALQLKAWGFLFIFAMAPAERRICPSVPVPPPHATSIAPAPCACSFSKPQQKLFFSARSQWKFVTAAVWFVFIWLSLCLCQLINNSPHQPDLGAVLHCTASFRKTE